jgi:hypothetical protein
MPYPRKPSPEILAAIDAMFAKLPQTYPDVEFECGAIDQAIRDRFAKVLEPHLNAFLKAKHPQTHVEGRELANHVDQTLDDLRLCAHVDGQPALLCAERKSPHDGDSLRFAVLTPKKNRAGFARTNLSEGIPPLSIMAAPRNIDSVLAPLREHAYAFARGKPPSR